MRREFRAWQKDHYNFMTPVIEKLWVSGGLVVELSRGAPFLGVACRGVSVYRWDGTTFQSVDTAKYNKPFSGESWEDVETEAIEYAERIFKELSESEPNSEE